MVDISIRKKSMTLRQYASVVGCARSFMLAQKYRLKISEFWPKFTFLLVQQIKIVLISFVNRYYSILVECTFNR